jgi:hypothetical protein
VEKRKGNIKRVVTKGNEAMENNFRVWCDETLREGFLRFWFDYE